MTNEPKVPPSELVRRRVWLVVSTAVLVALTAVAIWTLGDGQRHATGPARSTPESAGPQRVPLVAVGTNKGAAGLVQLVAAKQQASATTGQLKASVELQVLATGLPRTSASRRYEVWLYNSPSDAFSLGQTVTDARGTVIGSAPIDRAVLAKYQFVDISLEPRGQDRKHTGRSYLRGSL